MIAENIPLNRKKYSMKIIQQIISALYFLNKEFGINHRDIKPHNFLIYDNWVFKLADFGVSKYMNTDGSLK